MPASQVVTGGLGPGGSVAWVVTGGLGGFGATAPPEPAKSGVRDREILKALAELVGRTRQFDEVTTRGKPEFRGGSAQMVRLASFELNGWFEESLGCDPGGIAVERTVDYTLTIHVRDGDADERDDECDRLYSVAANALNGTSLDGQLFAEKGFLLRGKYVPTDGPERRLAASGRFSYEITSLTTRDDLPLY